MKMCFIAKANNSVFRNFFKKCLACVPSWSETTYGEFLHNGHLVRMEMKVIVKYSPHWTIRKSKGRSMFARRTPWGLLDWSSRCLNVLTWSDGPRYSSSSPCGTPSLPECSDQCNNWLPVRNRASRGYIETITKGALGCNNRLTIQKVGHKGKRTLLTTPTHDSYWLYFWGNFENGPIKWNHAHSASTSTARLPCILKRKLCCRTLYIAVDGVMGVAKISVKAEANI